MATGYQEEQITDHSEDDYRVPGVCLFACLMVFQQYFSYIMEVSFIGGENRRTRRKPLTCRKSLTNFIT